MTTWLIIALTIAAYLAVRLVRTQRTHNALIRALQHSVRLNKEASATHQHRADILTKAFAHQQSRIALLVAQNGELEDRNACLERMQRNAGLAYVLQLPEMDGPKVLETKGRITLN